MLRGHWTTTWKKAGQQFLDFDAMAQQGINVKTKNNIHQKFAVIDQKIVWYGSINLLSYGTSEESIMRIESVDIAAELMGIL